MSDVKVVYSGVEVVYDELKNAWCFELRGRDRSADSLAKAKEAIDKVPADKNKFERIPAYKRKSGWSASGYELCEITSIAEKGYRDKQLVWVSCDGKREKISADELIAVTPENEQLLRELAAVTEQRKSLDKVIDRKLSELTNVKIEVTA